MRGVREAILWLAAVVAFILAVAIGFAILVAITI